MSDYWVLTNKEDALGAVIDSIPQSGIANWKFRKGIPLAQSFESDVKISFSQNYPDAAKLYDFISNIMDLLIVSDKVKFIFEEESVNNIEYLPVSVHDHQKNLLSDNYWIVNLLGGQDIIDMKQSEVVMEVLEENQIDRIKKLIINPEKVEKNAYLFRATTKMDQYFVHDKIKCALEKNSITGYNIFPSNNWNGFNFK